MKSFDEFLSEAAAKPATVTHADRGLNTHTITVKKPGALTAHLEPYHIDKLRGLGDYETTKFKDKRGTTWHAKRDNGEYHLNATPKFHPENVLKFPIHHAD